MEGNKILGDLVIRAGQDIRDGKCGLSEEEIFEMVEIFGSRELTLEQTSDYLHIDRSSLTRKTGQSIPEPRKKKGGKKYYFLKDLLKIGRKK